MPSIKNKLSPSQAKGATSPLSRKLLVMLSALLLCGAALAQRSDRDGGGRHGNDGDNRDNRGKGGQHSQSSDRHGPEMHGTDRRGSDRQGQGRRDLFSRPSALCRARLLRHAVPGWALPTRLVEKTQWLHASGSGSLLQRRPALSAGRDLPHGSQRHGGHTRCAASGSPLCPRRLRHLADRRRNRHGGRCHSRPRRHVILCDGKLGMINSEFWQDAASRATSFPTIRTSF
jgi:hypothetical protein